MESFIGGDIIQVPNSDWSQFWLANTCPASAPALLWSLWAAGKVYIKCKGRQARRIYGLRVPEAQGHTESSHGQFILCSHGEDEMVSCPHWSYGGWLKTSGLSTQRKPPYCLPAFLVTQLHSLLHFILYIYACACVLKVQRRPAISGKKDTPHCEVALLSDWAGDSQFGNIIMSFNHDSRIICK